MALFGPGITIPKVDWKADPALRKQYADYAAGAFGQTSEQYGLGQGIDAQQAGWQDTLRSRAEGTSGPSVAENLLRQGLATSTAQQAGAMGSAASRGMNPALAAEIAARSGMQARGQASGQAATLRAQEQLAASEQYAALMAQRRAAAQGQYGQSAGLAGTAGRLGEGQDQLSLQAAMADQQAAANQMRLEAEQAQAKQDQISGLVLGAAGMGMKAGAAGATGGASLALPLADGGAVSPDAYSQAMRRRTHAPGDNPAKDTVPAKLTPGEIVIPLSILQGPDPVKRAARFVELQLEIEALKRGG